MSGKKTPYHLWLSIYFKSLYGLLKLVDVLEVRSRSLFSLQNKRPDPIYARYYMGVYDLEIQTAGMLAAAYALPGSVFRALGGWVSDKIGARTVMYITFVGCLVCLFFLSYPATDYTVHGIEEPIQFSLAIGLVPFVIITIFLGFFMSLGKAAVYKHIPVYYPDHVGSVGGLVGLVGGLGGFILPITFGMMNDIVGVWTSCFMVLFTIVAISLVWMHIAIIISDKRLHPELQGPKPLPEMLEED